MREIRFRGKCIEDCELKGQWLYGHYLKSASHFIAVDQGLVDGHFKLYQVDPETVGQYTGLRDKNGREIYEGDILRHTVDYGPGGEWERVTAIQLTPFGINVQPWIFCEEGYLPEIIGNIYENPELLKGAEA